MAALASPSGRRPNILITGTPGSGKTATSSQIAERTGFTHIEVSELVKTEGFHEGYDKEFDSYILDEDKLLDDLEIKLEAGGCVVDFHNCELFPERWFELVLVLRVDNTLLFDRLKDRGYSDHKIAENVECEIMQVILEEARESFAEEIVHEVKSETIEEMDSNVDRVVQWLEQWVQNNP